ncbi:DUF1760-domain-containing protein [Bimuria novae-zelandiae CBS 107.79]|uniref:DUF1760-domain-containing protein n=1 Tax=Bimuria novae-zelandiae CBS 107.79 TaxID=1447943 RepID=A0A6A5USQ2_9PLEO|nr:DUF1760-domain-containing protein [Bimuria novae-zelandiae CBS 107.79]
MDAEMKQGNPLLEALPPATDYLTYLTLVEQVLTEDNLPTLHQVLQDRELVTNIGWDLVHILLPLLPSSEECLQDVAAKGNPREVILKVTEALRLLEFEELEQDSDEEEEEEPKTGASSKAAAANIDESSTTAALHSDVLPPLPVLKFEVLLDLLSTLHGRVKAKYPSRFLATSLQAVLTAYNRATSHRDELTLSAIKLIKTLSGTKRPHLPPRTPSGNLLRTISNRMEPDPEAQSESPTVDEQTLTTRLFQSFLTHIMEDYILTISSKDDVPGFAWSSRLMEKYEPSRIVPGKKTYASRFAEEDTLKSRAAIVGQLVALAQDLGLKTSELVATIMDPENEKQGIPSEEDEPPNSAEDIPLSKTGALLLYTARTVKQELYTNVSSEDAPFIHIFPDHSTILQNYIGVIGQQTVGMEPEALLDAVLALGLIAVEKNAVGEPNDDDSFAKYLQTTSLISANSPSSSLRYHAHYLTSTTLRSHPSSIVRLTFIRDTLEHCPYENLKASAVTWLKGETLEANSNVPPSASSSSSHAAHDATHDTDSEDASIFSTPVALHTTAPFLFPDLTSTYTPTMDLSEAFIQFRQELGFYLAALNFYYLLLTAKPLHDVLDIRALRRESQLEGHYLTPLNEAVGRFKEALEEGGELVGNEGKEWVGQARGEVKLLEHVIGRVEMAGKAL